jgi:hypothetical protein
MPGRTASADTTTAAFADAEAEERRAIKACVVKAATEGRLRVTGRAHTGGTRPEFKGSVLGMDEVVVITSRDSFVARFDGTSIDAVKVTIAGAELECVVDAHTFDGGVWVRVGALADDYAWFWLELHAPVPPVPAHLPRRRMAAADPRA